MSRLILFTFMLTLFVYHHAAGAKKGHITQYSTVPTGGNCALPWGDLKASGLRGWTHYAALPKGSHPDRYESSANCGRCARVKHGRKETTVLVVDSCPSCPNPGDIDLSLAAWNAVTGNQSPSRYDGTWEFVECPSSFVKGNTKLRFKEGSTKYWFALQPYNHRLKITAVKVNGKNLALGAIDGFWWQGKGGLTFPATITIKNSKGQSSSVTIKSEQEVKKAITKSITLSKQL